jgi:uncharacterized membrane protein HdeD (DUF308 family)
MVNRFFDESRLALRNSLLALGAMLVMMGVLVFLFPEFIAFLLAAFIVFIGTTLLVAGVKVWQIEKALATRPQTGSTPFDLGHGERYYQRTFTFIVR